MSPLREASVTRPSRVTRPAHVIRGGLADNLAPSYARQDESAEGLSGPRRLRSPRPRVSFPYRSPFHRVVRLVGMAALLCSGLGLLAAVAGLPLNPLTMLAGLLLSLILIGYTVRPSLRKPRF